jgi:predicted dehydrogenase
MILTAILLKGVWNWGPIKYIQRSYRVDPAFIQTIKEKVKNTCANDINEFPGAHAENIRHFIDCIIRNADPIFVPQQGVDMIRIINSLYKSAETGREVLLGEPYN